MERFERQTGALLLEIKAKEAQLETDMQARKTTPRHVQWKELPPEERFDQLLPTRKHFIDTIRLMAYRPETTLVAIVREKLKREDDGRSLVRHILQSSVDLIEPLSHLCSELNATETHFPGTNLRLIFQHAGPPILPRNQES